MTDIEDTPANARLIAAAPDLLEGCELALMALKKVGEFELGLANPFQEVIVRLEHARAKAKGEG